LSIGVADGFVGTEAELAAATKIADSARNCRQQTTGSEGRQDYFKFYVLLFLGIQ